MKNAHYFTPTDWKEYELIDSGGMEKLERFGKYVLARPEPQAVWSKSLSANDWEKMAHARFVQEGSHSGKWEKLKKIEDQWWVNYQYKGMKLTFRLGLTGFKHVGIFPEQAVNWNFIYDATQKIKQAKVLNLFAYTGGASLAANAGGAKVIHCDAIKQVVNWASVNMEASGQKDIRWLIEDAFTFVKREAKRGNTYQGIILDPPAWGNGPKGEKWKLEEMVNELTQYIAQILAKKDSFLVFNSYSLGFSPLVLENLIQSHFEKSFTEKVEIGELYIPEKSGKKLPLGIVARGVN
jgi:23S rRNA (cytosine1962-C5)-methyltransferase